MRLRITTVEMRDVAITGGTQSTAPIPPHPKEPLEVVGDRIRMAPEHLLGKVFWAFPTRGRTCVGPRSLCFWSS